MKKMIVATCVAGVGALLGVSACSGSGSVYQYKLQGTVEAQQIDYDCPAGYPSMDMMAFTLHGKKKSGSSSGSSSHSKKTKTTTLSKPGRTDTADATRTATASPHWSASPKATVRNRGVLLSKKPDSPDRIRSIPSLKYYAKPDGCEAEYEIFVRDKKGKLYEQDVRRVDYNTCLRARVPTGQIKRLFPLCTKG